MKTCIETNLFMFPSTLFSRTFEAGGPPPLLDHYLL